MVLATALYLKSGAKSLRMARVPAFHEIGLAPRCGQYSLGTNLPSGGCRIVAFVDRGDCGTELLAGGEAAPVQEYGREGGE